jgi:hypothetical protein
MAIRVGLVDLVLQAVDGTKMGGNAIKDRISDHKGLEHLIEQLEWTSADLEAQNGTGGEWARSALPEELASTEARWGQMRQAKNRFGFWRVDQPD